MPDFSRRERQVMDVLHRRGHATAQEVLDELGELESSSDGAKKTLSYSAVRAVLRLLELQGHVNHIPDGRRYIFTPATTRNDARDAALNHVVDTFFEGSLEKTVRALVGRLSPAERERIRGVLDDA